MSTILKALRRLEEERESEARDLRDQVVARPRLEPHRPRLPLLAGAGAVGALLVVGGFWLLDDRPGEAVRGSAPRAPETVTSAPVDRAGAPLPVPTPSPEAGRARVVAAPGRSSAPTPAVVSSIVTPVPGVRSVTAPKPSPVATALDPQPQVTRVASEPDPQPQVTRVASEPDPQPQVTRVASEPDPQPQVTRVASEPDPQPQVTRVASEPDPQPQVTRVASSPPVASAADAASLPREMPGIVGQPEVVPRTPLLRIVVERTLWHPTPGRRLAYLHVAGRAGAVELREGDAVGDAVVQQIDPSAVVFLHRGVEIRRRIGADR